MADRDALIRKLVARKLRGLPLRDDAPAIPKLDGRHICRNCRENPVAEQGSQAHAEGLCAFCASWKRRHGGWRTPPLA